ncbi:Bifunctional polynucleotide phosphatase/kinase [Trichinella pseudospiralis]|uniref:Bifunctional polynucleotide phosphatase/kinase n=2 Tax=Trichinella pseudospiralis TaxID=6337 RepID=A0A0V0YAE1_TRIPS|nr:Bifunctional polynucleotide phosphatase/kinase [Trichinella pseudospiralis]KRY71196.1 Bifunctional polynucleotide phosphatase/kinase [Trichinella pseudospiralis]KRY82791.1 Bifunctional polynucleotide phosphatase/kinase [Trichinella pseudospiralis]KRZ22925.1 Bifunctional polynucleotide phosphatase/kinase [Trichinella pseudospiralis]KRZ39658.1 Bifunctional polynucleotide phosphatase/kinase [Trichinella pseudospiralis]
MLSSLSDRSFVIKLKDDRKTIIGRNELTGIRDLRCSRKHVSLKLNNRFGVCELIHKGRFKGAVCGRPVHLNEKRWLFHGDTLELLTGKYIFKFQRHNPIIPEQAYLKDLEYGSWQHHDSVMIYNFQSLSGNSLIAAFELYGGIVHRTPGGNHPRGMNDWVIAYVDVVTQLKKLIKKGYKIVIFTNQGGISTKRLLIDDFKKKIAAINRVLCVPFQCFAATADDWYRKPRPGMWELLCRMGNGGVEVNMSKSFFVGNSGVWIINDRVKIEYSSTDRLFAFNCGLKFWAAEEEFYNHKAPGSEAYKFPQRATFKRTAENLIHPIDTPLPVADEPEIILLCGVPAAGKTHYAKRHLEPLGVKIISWENDNLTLEQCLYLAEEILKKDQAVVVDATNPNVDSRKPFIDLASDFNYPIRCFLFEIPYEQAVHNYIYRKIKNPEYSRPRSLIDFYQKIMEPPSVEEGFDSIVYISFIPDFDDPADEVMYNFFLKDK